MWCVDSVCGARALTANATFAIADRCDDCAGEDLVVSARGLGWLSGVDYDVNPALQARVWGLLGQVSRVLFRAKRAPPTARR